jgi:hypothetical protein
MKLEFASTVVLVFAIGCALAIAPFTGPAAVVIALLGATSIFAYRRVMRPLSLNDPF